MTETPEFPFRSPHEGEDRDKFNFELGVYYALNTELDDLELVASGISGIDDEDVNADDKSAALAVVLGRAIHIKEKREVAIGNLMKLTTVIDEAGVDVGPYLP